MITIAALLSEGLKALSPHSSAHLETHALLAYVLKVDRSTLLAWPEREVENPQAERYQALLQRRAKGEPFAYIVGEKEFWSLDFKVTPDTLIPRPETELLVELLADTGPDEEGSVVDLGTGTGAIAIALATERPRWQVHATDKSPAALAVAKENSKRHKTQVQFYEGDWFEALPKQRYDAIVSNPPYIHPDDEHLTQGDVRYEPQSALVAQEEGLKDIASIVMKAPEYLKLGGILLIEHGADQGNAVKAIMEQAGFSKVKVHQDLAGKSRACWGCMPTTN